MKNAEFEKQDLKRKNIKRLEIKNIKNEIDNLENVESWVPYFDLKKKL
jgi:hypothetical protein